LSPHLGAMLAIFAVTLAISLGLTPLVRRFAIQRGMVDKPGAARRVHTIAVPRLGGLAMYIAFAAGTLLMFGFNVHGLQGGLTGNSVFEPARILFALAGAGLVTLVMAIDDVRGVRPLPRLLWQIGAALLVIVPALIWPGGPNLGESADTLHYDQGAGVLALSVQNPLGGAIVLPLAVAVVLTIFWIVGMTNAINWIDGLDGLAGGVSVVACLVMFIITWRLEQYTLAYLPLILGAATLGFLPYNIHPARIFMGDSGAMFLGFALAVISIIGGAKMASVLLVLGIPLLDGVYMIIYRLYRGRSPLSADRGHLHHRLLDIGFSQQQVVLIFYLLCGIFGVLAFLLTSTTDTLNILGFELPRGLYKLFALALLVVVLVGLMVFITRRNFDKASER
jgi:UDP-GlcNAc:undecaprenyl-phosphate/decaprenyl-phosphate GlcNAc-1-phosphate transferase